MADFLDYIENTFLKPGLDYRFVITFFDTYTSDFSFKNFTSNPLSAAQDSVNFTQSITMKAFEVELPSVEIVYENINSIGTKRNNKVAIGQNINGTLNIRRAVGFSNEYFNWFEAVTKNLEEPDLKMFKNCFIQQLNQYGDIIRLFVMTKCRPITYNAPKFDALGEAVSIEELRVSVEGEFLSNSATLLGI